jgi:hypothetical protein
LTPSIRFPIQPSSLRPSTPTCILSRLPRRRRRRRCSPLARWGPSVICSSSAY